MRSYFFTLLIVALGTLACSAPVQSGDPSILVSEGGAVRTPSPTVAPSPELVLAVTHGDGQVGQTVSINIVAYKVTTGIAGFDFRVSVSEPAVARIASVQLPDYGLRRVSELPGPGMDIRAADIHGIMEEELPQAVLATLDLELLSPGSTHVLLEARILDDDFGNPLKPQSVEQGSVTARSPAASR